MVFKMGFFALSPKVETQNPKLALRLRYSVHSAFNGLLT